MTNDDALSWAIRILRSISDSPALDAEVLLCFVLKKSRESLYSNPDRKLSQLEISKYRNLIAKRARHWPVAYLTGHKEFYMLDFKVTPDVLIPRPETELLVELGMKAISDQRLGIRNVIDIGTGTGNIIISLAKTVIARIRPRRRRSNLNFYAIDSSRKALQIAKSNARRHGVANKIKFLRDNLLDPVFRLPLMRGRMSGGRSIVIANLPYLTPFQYSQNPDLSHEPRSALVAGPDGLKYYRELFSQLSRHCERQRSNPNEIATSPAGSRNDNNIILLLEHSPSQKPALQKLTRSYFFRNAKMTFHRDLTGKYRVVEVSV